SDRPGDDLLVGRLIAEQGCKVELIPYAIQVVADYASLSDLFRKRLRWMVVMRHMRPWGHLGLLLTQALPWILLAIAVNPTATVIASYLGTYFLLRAAMTWIIGSYGLKQPVWKKLALIPIWDSMAFAIWLVSFTRSSIRWRNIDYDISSGKLEPI